MAEAVTALNYQGNTTQPAEAQNEASATAPGAGATIVTDPSSGSLAPGLYNVTWEVALSGAAAAADANNFGLYLNGVLQLQSVNPGAAGSWAQQAVEVQSTVAAPGVLTVKAIGAGTASVVYSAQVVATPVPQTAQDAPPLPAALALTANGSVVTMGPLSVTLNGFDATGTQAECQLGRGGNLPAGSSEQGFVDTTYTLTAAQVQAGSQMGA